MNLKKLSDDDYKKMSQEVTEYRKNAKMTKKERSAQDISGYSALPLVTLFFYWPIGAVLGGVIGAGIGLVTGGAAAILPGISIGLAGGSVTAWATGIGQAILGGIKAKNVEKNFHKRIEKDVRTIHKKYLKKNNSFNFSVSSFFNNFSKKSESNKKPEIKNAPKQKKNNSNHNKPK